MNKTPMESKLESQQCQETRWGENPIHTGKINRALRKSPNRKKVNNCPLSGQPPKKNLTEAT